MLTESERERERESNPLINLLTQEINELTANYIKLCVFSLKFFSNLE